MLLTTKELAAKLNVKESWIRHMLFKGLLPHIKISRLLRFNPNEIEKWLDERSRASSEIKIDTKN